MRARQLRVAYADLHDQRKHHHEGEGAHVFPFLVDVEGAAAMVEVRESEHQAMPYSLTEAHTARDTHATPGSTADAHAARSAIVRAGEVVERQCQDGRVEEESSVPE